MGMGKAPKGNASVRYGTTEELIFGSTKITPTLITIDGYSNQRTLSGALGELANVLDKFDKGEGDALRTIIKSKDISVIYDEGGYSLDFESVPGAVNYMKTADNPHGHTYGDKRKKRKLKGYEVYEDAEYANAKWYVSTTIVR